MAFASEEVDNSILFDSNVVVDLSRVGSQETKALLMGILVMRLSEHRMTQATESNQKLHHITVLEEAHNILKSSTSKVSEDGGDISGKSVEMISNAIAEMRTYGEGFIIADQSPNAVDISAIRNTNTKIIMRLLEESDRRLAGKSAALKDNQLDEIARLPKGVAVVYQNDWVEPILHEGEPDFSEVAKGFVEIDDFSEERDANFDQADEKLAAQRGCTPEEVAKWREENKYTWHECKDCKTMQKVPTEVHGNISHSGGISEQKSQNRNL